MSLSLEAASARGEEGICAIEASKWQHLAASCRSLNCQLDLWFEILPTILICNNNKENKKPQCGHEMLRTMSACKKGAEKPGFLFNSKSDNFWPISGFDLKTKTLSQSYTLFPVVANR